MTTLAHAAGLQVIDVPFDTDGPALHRAVWYPCSEPPRALPAQHEYQIVPNAGHFAFLTPCSPTSTMKRPEVCTDTPGFDRAAFHTLLDTDVVTFFQTHLKVPGP